MIINNKKVVGYVLLISLILIMVFSFVSCDKDNIKVEDNMDNYTWYEITNNTLNISLKGNYTTGYTWVYEVSNIGMIKEDYNEYIQDSNKDGMVGVGGVQHYTFSALEDGEVTITFNYLRTFEDNSTVNTKQVTLTINNGIMTIK